MVRKGHGSDWMHKRMPMFRPIITYYHFRNHPNFPNAKDVFTVISALKAGKKEKRHVVIVALREIARELHEKAGGLEHVHSENLGGEQGAYVAHVFKSSSAETHASDYHWNCKNANEVLEQFRQWFIKSHLQVDLSELKRIVKKVV